jgi:hypothetical protein
LKVSRDKASGIELGARRVVEGREGHNRKSVPWPGPNWDASKKANTLDPRVRILYLYLPLTSAASASLR